MKRYLPFVIIAAVLTVAIGAGIWMFRSAQPQPQPSVASVTQAPANSPAATPDAATSPRAYVTIEEFGDYQCPPCGGLHPTLKTLKDEYGNRIRFVFRHFPLTQIHKHALEASYAAAAAGLQGKFWEMHDLLYDNQNVWSEVGDFRPVAINFALKIGLDRERFMRDMDGLKVMALVSEDTQRANSVGVNSTPTVFIDGRLIENLTAENLRKEINQRLGESK